MTDPAPVIIQKTPDGECELCGMVAECRPYGPKGENVCFECGMRDEKGVQARFAARLEAGD